MSLKQFQGLDKPVVWIMWLIDYKVNVYITKQKHLSAFSAREEASIHYGCSVMDIEGKPCL